MIQSVRARVEYDPCAKSQVTCAELHHPHAVEQFLNRCLPLCIHVLVSGHLCCIRNRFNRLIPHYLQTKNRFVYFEKQQQKKKKHFQEEKEMTSNKTSPFSENNQPFWLLKDTTFSLAKYSGLEDDCAISSSFIDYIRSGSFLFLFSELCALCDNRTARGTYFLHNKTSAISDKRDWKGTGIFCILENICSLHPRIRLTGLLICPLCTWKVFSLCINLNNTNFTMKAFCETISVCTTEVFR